MAFNPDKAEVEPLRRRLHDEHGLTHLRVRQRGKVLTLESGPVDAAHRHARFRRDTVHLWTLEMPGRGSRWQKTLFRDTLDTLTDLLVKDFPWMVAPIEPIPDQT